jgi:hypothetical protein
MTTTNDPLNALRAAHGPVTEDELHRAADMALDAWLARRDAEVTAMDRALDPPPPDDQPEPWADASILGTNDARQALDWQTEN